MRVRQPSVYVCTSAPRQTLAWCSNCFNWSEIKHHHDNENILLQLQFDEYICHR